MSDQRELIKAIGIVAWLGQNGFDPIKAARAEAHCFEVFEKADGRAIGTALKAWCAQPVTLNPDRASLPGAEVAGSDEQSSGSARRGLRERSPRGPAAAAQ